MPRRILRSISVGAAPCRRPMTPTPINTAIRWVRYAGRDWADYLAARAAEGEVDRPRQPDQADEVTGRAEHLDAVGRRRK